MISDNQQGRILNIKEIMLQNIDLKSIVVHKSLNREQTKLFIENLNEEYVYFKQQFNLNKDQVKRAKRIIFSIYENNIINGFTKVKSLENYYLDEQNRLFVHAGFTNMNGVSFEFFPELFYWDRTLWETALALDKKMKKSDLLYPKRFTLYDEIFIGHTPVSRIGKTTPVKMVNIWNIDTGAAFKGPLTIMDVDTKEFWQSEPLPNLYPNEKGRN